MSLPVRLQGTVVLSAAVCDDACEVSRAGECTWPCVGWVIQTGSNQQNWPQRLRFHTLRWAHLYHSEQNQAFAISHRVRTDLSGQSHTAWHKASGRQIQSFQTEYSKDTGYFQGAANLKISLPLECEGLGHLGPAELTLSLSTLSVEFYKKALWGIHVFIA